MSKNNGYYFDPEFSDVALSSALMAEKGRLWENFRVHPMAADAADADLGSVPNLVKYAFGQNANDRLSQTIPSPNWQGSVFRRAFPEPDPTRAKRVKVRAGASAFLTSGSWQGPANTGGASSSLFDLPTDTNPHAFLCLILDLNP